MLFDRVAELPVATVRRTSRNRLELVVGQLAHWVLTRWRWLRPRTIPVTVAFLGLIGVVQSVNYLSTPPAAETATASLQATDGPPAAMIYVDGKPYLDGQRMPDLETTGYRVRLVLQR